MKTQKLTFRDELALDRTYLAKERTILAYIRTGLALAGVGLLIYRFFDMDETVKIFPSLIFIMPGVYTTIIGSYKTFKVRREMRDLEKKCVRGACDGN
jgi:putative membrane protein